MVGMPSRPPPKPPKRLQGARAAGHGTAQKAHQRLQRIRYRQPARFPHRSVPALTVRNAAVRPCARGGRFPDVVWL